MPWSCGLADPITQGGRGFSLQGLPGSRDQHFLLPLLQVSTGPTFNFLLSCSKDKSDTNSECTGIMESRAIPPGWREKG